jgi:holo-[acyl-carrier protein] synthase
MLGIGVCDVDRIARLYEKYGGDFLACCFTDEEIDYAFSTRSPAEHLAGRWAAKQALERALGGGAELSWRRTCVSAGDGGSPVLELELGGRGIFSAGGAPRLRVSLTHTGRSALALVTAEPDD